EGPASRKREGAVTVRPGGTSSVTGPGGLPFGAGARAWPDTGSSERVTRAGVCPGFVTRSPGVAGAPATVGNTTHALAGPPAPAGRQRDGLGGANAASGGHAEARRGYTSDLHVDLRGHRVAAERVHVHAERRAAPGLERVVGPILRTDRGAVRRVQRDREDGVGRERVHHDQVVVLTALRRSVGEHECSAGGGSAGLRGDTRLAAAGAGHAPGPDPSSGAH